MGKSWMSSLTPATRPRSAGRPQIDLGCVVGTGAGAGPPDIEMGLGSEMGMDIGRALVTVD